MDALDLRRMGVALLLAFVLLAGVSLPAPAGASPPSDQYIVVLERGVDADRVAAQHEERFDADVRRTHERLLNAYTAQISPAELSALRDDPRVDYVEPDRVVRASATQVNPPWGLDRVDQVAQPLDGGYTYGSTGAGVTAYILDTGIRATHQDFGGRVAAGFSAIADGRGSADCNGHGTHVAGTVGGAAHGIAKAVSLVPVRVLDCEGNGTTSGVIAGVEWVSARLPRPAVANMSLGGGPSQALDTAVRTSIAKGIVYTLAAGNEGADACQGSPGRVAEGLTIAATTRSDARPSWSNHGTCVDWFAPGAGIQSAYYTSDTAIAMMSGTSMAAPHTAGAAALLLERQPTASPAEVRETLAAQLTEGVVTEANSAANDLLHVPPAALLAPPDSAPQPAPAPEKAPQPAPVSVEPAPAPTGSEAAPPEVDTPAAPLATTLLRPSGYRILSGTPTGRGGTARLARDDSVRVELRGRNRGTRARSELGATTVVDRTGPAPIQLSLLVDLRVSAPAAVTLRLYDFERRRFETLLARRVGSSRDQRLAWSSDRPPSAYVGPTGRVALVVGAVTDGPHHTGIDQIRVGHVR